MDDDDDRAMTPAEERVLVAVVYLATLVAVLAGAAYLSLRNLG
jgi:hypothetical protein